MAITFPASPTNGQTFTSGNKTWQWDGTTWLAYGASLSPTVLKVDAANARVGINNQSPAYALDVNGTIKGTQFLQGTDYLSPYQGFRNKIINGDFSIWQRSTGTGFGSSAFIGAADRWYHVSGVSYGMATVSRVDIAPGIIPGYDAQYFLNSINYNYLANFFSQRIEDVRTLAGRTVTLSFWVNNFGYGNNLISSSLTQNFGTGGSTEVVTNFSNVSTINGWVRQSLTVTLPSISGKTIGTNSYLKLQFSTNNHLLVGIAGVQLEQGSVATPFEQRPIGTELALCQRYFQLINSYMSTGDFAIPMVRESATLGQSTVSLPVSMRAYPSLYGTTYGRCVFRDTAFGVAVPSVSSISINASGPSFNAITLVIVHGSAAGTYVFSEWDMYATSANLGLSAEL